MASKEEAKEKEETNHYSYRMRRWFFDSNLGPDEIVIEQPEKWGKNACAKGFSYHKRQGSYPVGFWSNKEQPIEGVKP